jgi:hypothetical protein
MLKPAVVLAFLLAPLSLFASAREHSFTILTPVLAPANLASANQSWVNPVAAGEVRQYTDGTRWMFTEAAGGTNAIAAPRSLSTVVQVSRNPRSFATLQNTGAVDVWIAFGGSRPTAGAGLKLIPGAFVFLKRYDGIVWALPASGTGVLSITELF